MTKAQTVADLRDYAGSGEPVTLTVTPSSLGLTLDAMLMLTYDRSPSPSSAHNSSAYDPSAHTPPTTQCGDGTNRTESDLSATATVRCPEAAENASIKRDSPAAQTLCDESPPPDKLDSNLLQQFDDRTLDDLLKERRALRRVLASALASAEFFFDFQPSPLEIAKIEPLSDEEIAALETEIFGSGDIEAPRLDPIPSLPFSNGTTIDAVPAPSITETTESSASGGAVRRILDVRTDPTLGSGDMAGSFVCRPAPDLPTISVGKITAFRLCCEAGFQPDVQAAVRPPERSSRTNLWRERIRERSAGADAYWAKPMRLPMQILFEYKRSGAGARRTGQERARTAFMSRRRVRADVDVRCERQKKQLTSAARENESEHRFLFCVVLPNSSNPEEPGY